MKPDMNTTYNYDKFKEWLTLKKYSPATVASVIRIAEYFRQWAIGKENITELEEVSYRDVVSFMQWSSKHGASQKTIANYLNHIRKLYQFLISEGEAKQNPVAHIKVQGIKRKIYYDVLSTGELEKLYREYPTTIEHEAGKIVPPQQKNILSRRRNKVILGLLIHQGLRVEEIAAITLQDLRLREGKIIIHAQRRTAARTMRLESHQVFEMMDYVNGTRKEFLQANGATDKLFLQWEKGENFYGITQLILKHLRKINSRIKNFEQIRASVITEWLKQYDLRKVQYLSGHKYVSSTEHYKENIIDGLQGDIAKFHPL
jgi:site-specific recombinase XerD